MVKINAAEAKLLSLLVPTKERCGDDVFSEANPEVNVTQVPFDKETSRIFFLSLLGFWLVTESCSARLFPQMNATNKKHE